MNKYLAEFLGTFALVFIIFATNNYLAIGALTHSAPALDIGLDFRKGK